MTEMFAGLLCFGGPVAIVALVIWVIMLRVSGEATADHSPKQCPNCKSFGMLRWEHETVHGDPDLRYSVNMEYCRKCGWRS